MQIFIIISSCLTNLAGEKINISKRFMNFLNENFCDTLAAEYPDIQGLGAQAGLSLGCHVACVALQHSVFCLKSLELHKYLSTNEKEY